MNILKNKSKDFLLKFDDTLIEFDTYVDMKRYINNCRQDPDKDVSHRLVTFSAWRGHELNPMIQGKLWVID